MYEVELKIELTPKEKEKLEQAFKDNNFEFIKQTPQKDYYIEAKKSKYYNLQEATYDVKRYRNENGEFLYTAKVWEIKDGHLARQQKEYKVTKEKFEEEIKKYSEAIKIEKIRDWYLGEYEGQSISLTIDTVDFDHSKNTRYFFEAEVGVEDKNKVKETKENIKEFIQQLLDKEEIIEAPGMFTMAFEKK